MPEKAAEQSAIRQANILSGNIAKHEMTRLWNHFTRLAFFSRGYTSSVIRQMTRSFVQDKTLMARLEEQGYTPAEVERYLNMHQEELTKGLVMDYANNWIIAQMTNYATTAAQNEPDRNGKAGGHFTWKNVGAEPMQEALFPTRIFISRDEQTGDATYMETPMRTGGRSG